MFLKNLINGYAFVQRKLLPFIIQNVHFWQIGTLGDAVPMKLQGTTDFTPDKNM